MNTEIIKQIHKGRNSIYIVKYNGRTCILKKPKNDSRIRAESLKRQLERIKFWRKHNLSKVKAIRFHDGILKTYVKGKTLSKIIGDNKHFFSENSDELKALKKFVTLLVESKHFIHDMKGANIILNNDMFQIIDSGPIYKEKRVKKEYRKILYIKWSKLLKSNNEKRHLKKFLNSF